LAEQTDIFVEQAVPATDEGSEMNVEICYTNLMIINDLTDHMICSCLQVCSLKWCPDKNYLASGGKDKQLFIWNLHSLSPVQKYSEHLATVKGIYSSLCYFYL
jgi:WD40 repeat protein